MITVGDFILRHKKLQTTRLLPLEKVEVVEGDTFLACNRFGATCNVNRSAVIEFDSNYEAIVWDELIQLEQQILFLMECAEDPNGFRFLQGVGIVKLTDQQKVVQPYDRPWETVECNTSILQVLSEARLSQIDSKLTELEEQHDFLTEALESVW